MSSQLPAAAQSTAISKSAAKKRAKKAAKALAASKETTGSVASEDPGSVQLHHHHHQHHHHHPAPSASLSDASYAFPPGAYPDPGYDAAYYDDAELPSPAGSGAAAAAAAAAAATAAAASAAAGGAGGGGAPSSDQFSFGSYAFVGDRGTIVPQANGSPFGGLSPSINITHEDLLETANELWKRMGETAYGDDDPYWSSLPTHVRQFIREAIPFNGLNNTNNDPQATQKDLYAMAQRIVHAASQGMGLQGVGSNLLSQVNGRAHLQASIAEDLGFHHHPDSLDRGDDEYDDDDEFDDEPDTAYSQPNGDAPKKKNKKKKKKAAGQTEPPPAALPPPAVKQPPRQPVPPQPPMQQPALNPPPPPATPAPTQSTPTSRAAGKQPMTHAPAPAANAPTRSVRAAGKAPMSAAQHTHHSHSHPPPAKPAGGKGKATATAPPAKIWTTASAEERENITQFWLGLTEAERRDLLQIEKDAVLRRMKEQQRHSCACAVCGRKKVNIEKELDQLYEQYYNDLERYTQHQRASAINIDVPPPPGAGPFPGSVELDSSGQLLKLDHLAPNPATHPSLDESDEYEEDEEYEEEEELDDDEIGSEEAEVDYAPRKATSKALPPKPEGSDDFYGFGSTLATIKGVITVADDMLKNDGAKFLEMMEQLAVKRGAREDLNVRELQEETDEDDDDESVSESQRLEDGRRMFAIFAARMFEQRVLQAYRERVAKEREEQLLRELEMEEDTKRAREEKKAKEAQRKKDKKKAQKQRQDEERAARDAALAEEQRQAKLKAEEQERQRHKRQEEERQRREAAKRAAQEEATRREAERKKRQEEERAREEEAARKKREREEKIRKEREAREREAKDKERREKEEKERLAKERAEKERVAKEARDKAAKEAQAKLEEERLERLRRDEAARRERDAIEQKKLIAAQQAAREKAAADKAAMAAARASASVRPKASVPTAPSTSRNGSTPPGSTPAHLSSPPTPGSSSVRPAPVTTRGGPPKTPQTAFYNQPVPGMAGFNARPSAPGGGFVQGYGTRPPFPSQSPVFAAPQSNGQGMMSSSLTSSPSAVSRGFGGPDPSSSFDFDTSRGPPGLGFPGGKVGSSSRGVSTDDAFRAPGAPAPIGQRVPSQPASLYGDPEADPFVMGRIDTTADPIAPPPGPIGSRPSFDHAIGGVGGPVPRAPSPSQPEKVLGSAALGAADDEIVQPAARRQVPPPGPAAPGWKMPSSAPGAGRWSAAPPSIWGIDQSTPWSRGTFGAPGAVGGGGGAPPVDFGRGPDPLGAGAPGLGGVGVGGVPPIGGGGPRRDGSAPGPPGAAFGAPGGYGAYPQNLFGPPQPHNHH